MNQCQPHSSLRSYSRNDENESSYIAEDSGEELEVCVHACVHACVCVHALLFVIHGVYSLFYCSHIKSLKYLKISTLVWVKEKRMSQPTIRKARLQEAMEQLRRNCKSITIRTILGKSQFTNMVLVHDNVPTCTCMHNSLTDVHNSLIFL